MHYNKMGIKQLRKLQKEKQAQLKRVRVNLWGGGGKSNEGNKLTRQLVLIDAAIRTWEAQQSYLDF